MGKTNESAYAEREKFIADVRKYEAAAKADPKAYEQQCRRTVALGFWYIFALLALLVGLIGVIIAIMVSSDSGYGIQIKLIIVIGIAVFGLIRALFSRIPDSDDGVSVSRSDAPKLWAEVDRVREHLKAPEIHRLRILFDWNASASQIPRFGLFGPCKNTLRYGLPLMLAETPDEMRATIAHELGHFAGGHSRFAGRAYRVVEVWRAAAEHLSGVGAFLVRPFLNWYMPKLWATTFPLRRQDEYTADAAATDYVGQRANAQGLVRLGAQSKTVAKAMGALYDLVNEMPSPPSDAYTRVRKVIQEPLNPDDYRKQLRERLADETDYDDTHPSTSDRLKAIGVLGDVEVLISDFESAICEPASPSAADEFLDRAMLDKLEAGLNLEWYENLKAHWKDRHDAIRPDVEALSGLRGRDISGIPTRELATHLSRSIRIQDEDLVESIAHAILKQDPEHAEANLVVGFKLASDKDPAALAHLDLAARDVKFRERAYYERAMLAEKLGQRDEAARFYDMSVKEEESVEAFARERLEFPSAKDLRAATPTEDEVRAWTPIFERAETLEYAYLVEFASALRPSETHRLIVVIPKFPKFVSDETKNAYQVLDELGVIDHPIRALTYPERGVRKKLDALVGARLFPG